MKKYPKYKKTDIEWIGNIPENWNIQRLKHISKYEKGKNSQLYTKEFINENSGEIPVYSGQTNNRGVMGYVDRIDYSTDGSLIVTTVGAKAMTVKYIEGDFCLSQNCALVNSRTESFNIKYAKYLLPILFEYEKNLLSQIMQPSLRFDDLDTYKVVTPSPEEQTSIATYLDHKTALIDKLIASNQKQIKLLEEKRKATINQAVTKGLDPNVKMKDSGVEWIGEIPEHWEVKKLKWLVKDRLKYGANEPAIEENIEHPRYIRITDFGNDGKLRNSTYKSLPPEKAKDYLLEDGDILFARSGATVGKTFQYKEHKGTACFAGYLIKATPDEEITSDFLYYFTKSSSYENWRSSILTQATIQNIGADKYNELVITLPNIQDQLRIIKFLDVTTKAITSLVQKLKVQERLLKEYRQSVISKVVTGKIDIREEAHRLENQNG